MHYRSIPASGLQARTVAVGCSRDPLGLDLTFLTLVGRRVVGLPERRRPDLGGGWLHAVRALIRVVMYLKLAGTLGPRDAVDHHHDSGLAVRVLPRQLPGQSLETVAVVGGRRLPVRRSPSRVVPDTAPAFGHDGSC